MSNFPLKNAADQLATQGRYGDTMMVHMNPIEVDALAKLSPTGQLTINPQTGQPEAFLPLLGSLLAPTLLGGTALAGTLGTVGASALYALKVFTMAVLLSGTVYTLVASVDAYVVITCVYIFAITKYTNQMLAILL